MPTCAAANCVNSPEKGFFMVRFPKDPQRREQWRKLVAKSHRDPNWQPKSYSRICEAHFLQNQWKSPRSTLKSDAFPINFCMCAAFVSESKGLCHPACNNKPPCTKTFDLQNKAVHRCHAQSSSSIQHRESCPIFYEPTPVGKIVKSKPKKLEENLNTSFMEPCCSCRCSQSLELPNCELRPHEEPTPKKTSSGGEVVSVLEWNSVMTKINELEERARTLHLQSKQSLFAQVHSLQAQDESDDAADMFEPGDDVTADKENVIELLKKHPIQTSEALIALLEDPESTSFHEEHYVSADSLTHTLSVFKTEELTKATEKIGALETRIMELERTIQSLQEQVTIN